MDKQPEAKERQLSPRLLAGIIVALFFGIALYLRVYLPYDQVFTDNWIKFTGIDAYYQMYLVDNLAHNFPRLMSFDPYFVYPDGAGVGSVRFFNWLLASVVWIISLGSPTQHTIDVVGVYFPAVLAALTVIPVYFIGKELFSRWAGVLSAGLIAVMPGEFLGRSILGFTDQHVAETLFTTVTILFLILAVKAARQRELTFSHLKHRDWATIAKPAFYSLLTGIFLGIYLFTWLGALLFVFVISLFFIIQFIIDHLKHKSTDYLCLIGVILFVTALIMFLPVSPGRFYSIPLVFASLIPPVLSSVSWLMTRREIKPLFYPLSLIGLGFAGLAIFYIINPSLLKSMRDAFSIFAPSGVSLTTLEMQSIFPEGVKFFLTPAWGNFNTGFILSLLSLLILILIIIKRGDAGKSLLVVWSLVMLAATLGQRRFAYYFVVNVTILTGYVSIIIYFLTRLIIEFFSGKDINYLWQLILEFAGFKERIIKPTETPKRRDYDEVLTEKNYYEILGISRNATAKEMKRAFRKLTDKYHHEGNLEDEAANRFQAITEAYEVLSAPHKRVAYDRAKFSKREAQQRKSGLKQGISFHITTRQVSTVLGAIILVFFLTFFPNMELLRTAKERGTTAGRMWLDTCLIGSAINTANLARFAPSDAWCSSLSWLKENTPDPFGDPDFYYKHHEPPPPEENYQHPESAYGVMAWWDYGYWITRIGHRIPNANPSQNPESINKVASFFTSQDESSAQDIVKELGSSYVIVDADTVLGKFYAIAAWAGRNQSDYLDIYYLLQENKLTPFRLFHPEYYQSLSTRLYNFDGKAVTPQRTLVISYEEKVDRPTGQAYKQITSDKAFPSYEMAIAYISSQKSGNYRIVGENPFASPVPLEALKHYKLVHSSDELAAQQEVGMVPIVKIFEYIE
ncbi:oligosaccharyl transferase, archaeosortase A system-associated [Chloroflexota bacterium]